MDRLEDLGELHQHMQTGRQPIEAGGSDPHTHHANTASTSGTAVRSHGCYLIVHNVSKRHNIGTLVRSAAAFGVTEVCLVGARQFNTFGSHGSADYVNYRHFPSLQECCRYLKEDRGCRVMGVEITEHAQPIQAHPFSGPTAFMLGNEGSGMSTQQAQLCDAFVYIPQYGAGTASLNITVAASIVLQHFAAWAGYPERPRTGEKFEVGERPQRTGPRGMVPLTEEERAAERERRQERRAAANGHDEVQNSDEEGVYSFLGTGLLDPFLEGTDAGIE